jgi:hypothetical protein
LLLLKFCALYHILFPIVQKQPPVAISRDVSEAQAPYLPTHGPFPTSSSSAFHQPGGVDFEDLLVLHQNDEQGTTTTSAVTAAAVTTAATVVAAAAATTETTTLNTKVCSSSTAVAAEVSESACPTRNIACASSFELPRSVGGSSTVTVCSQNREDFFNDLVVDDDDYDRNDNHQDAAAMTTRIDNAFNVRMIPSSFPVSSPLTAAAVASINNVGDGGNGGDGDADSVSPASAANDYDTILGNTSDETVALTALQMLCEQATRVYSPSLPPQPPPQSPPPYLSPPSPPSVLSSISERSRQHGKFGNVDSCCCSITTTMVEAVAAEVAAPPQPSEPPSVSATTSVAIVRNCCDAAISKDLPSVKNVRSNSCDSGRNDTCTRNNYCSTVAFSSSSPRSSPLALVGRQEITTPQKFKYDRSSGGGCGSGGSGGGGGGGDDNHGCCDLDNNARVESSSPVVNSDNLRKRRGEHDFDNSRSNSNGEEDSCSGSTDDDSSRSSTSTTSTDEDEDGQQYRRRLRYRSKKMTKRVTINNDDNDNRELLFWKKKFCCTSESAKTATIASAVEPEDEDEDEDEDVDEEVNDVEVNDNDDNDDGRDDSDGSSPVKQVVAAAAASAVAMESPVASTRDVEPNNTATMSTTTATTSAPTTTTSTDTVAAVSLATSPTAAKPKLRLSYLMRKYAADFDKVINLNRIYEKMYFRHIDFLRQDLTEKQCRTMSKMLRRDRFRVEQVTTLVYKLADVLSLYFYWELQKTKRYYKNRNISPPPRIDDIQFEVEQCQTLQFPVTSDGGPGPLRTGSRRFDTRILSEINELIKLCATKAQRIAAMLPEERKTANLMGLTDIFSGKSILQPMKTFVRAYAQEVLGMAAETFKVARSEDEDDDESNNTAATVPLLADDVNTPLASGTSSSTTSNSSQTTTTTTTTVETVKRSWRHEFRKIYFVLSYLVIINDKFLLYEHHCDVIISSLPRSKDAGHHAKESHAIGIDVLPQHFWKFSNNKKYPYTFFSVLNVSFNVPFSTPYCNPASVASNLSTDNEDDSPCTVGASAASPSSTPSPPSATTAAASEGQPPPCRFVFNSPRRSRRIRKKRQMHYEESPECGISPVPIRKKKKMTTTSTTVVTTATATVANTVSTKSGKLPLLGAHFVLMTDVSCLQFVHSPPLPLPNH